jgi:hypothetical protein
MTSSWGRVALFLVTLACAIGALVAAGLEEEGPASDAIATAPAPAPASPP